MISVFCRLLMCALWWLISTADGAEQPVVVASGSGTNAPRQPQAAFDASGRIHLVFGVGNQVMYLTSSVDGGRSFSEAIKLGHGAWNLDACPMDGGMLSIGLNDRVETVWRRDREVITAGGDGTSEQVLGIGHQPWMTSSAEGPVFIWTLKREGELVIRIPGDVTFRTLASMARDPIIVSARNGRGAIVCCWESKQGEQTSVMAARVDVH